MLLVTILAVNDRTIKIGLQGQPLNLTLIQVYAPTSTVSEDTIESFYNQLQDVLDNVLKQDVIMAVEDFNATVDEGFHQS